MSTAYWTVPPEWTGETCYVLGCGPSLRGFDARVLRGRGRVITVNDSFRLAPWADVLYACDLRWWQTRRAAVEAVWQGRRMVTLENHALENQIPGVLRLRNSGEDGLETDTGALRTGKNSGYQAIGLAYHFGASRIVLLGFDMRLGRHGELHWNERSDGQTPQGFAQTLGLMLPKFETLRDPLAIAGVQVVNATPGSALRVWPMVRLGDVLNENIGGKDEQGYSLRSSMDHRAKFLVSEPAQVLRRTAYTS